MVPMRQVNSFAALNAALQVECRADMQRQLRGSPETVGEKLADERARMLELPQSDYKACRLHSASSIHTVWCHWIRIAIRCPVMSVKQYGCAPTL